MNRKLMIAICPIIVGGLIYITYRVDTLKMYTLIDKIGMTSFVIFFRENDFLQGLHIPDWVKYSLPDALWIFSFTYSLLLLWQFKVTRTNAFWLLIAPATGLFLEIGQFFGVISGTFDIIDLLLLIVAMTIPLYNLKSFNLKSINNDKIKQHI
jgi:peptidoglycan/LPS O-acetylase OafA/YrhL